MASNPMQRQKRISFLLGFLTMLLISATIIGLLGYTLVTMKKEEEERVAAMQDVYVVSTDIASGTSVNAGVIDLQKVEKEVVPSNKFTSNNLLDEEGNIREDIVAKIDLKMGTVLTTDMVVIDSQVTTPDLREQEYNIATLPTEIQTGDYVDIRVRFPSGLDYIIVSKKLITIPQIMGMDSPNNFSIELSENETIAMSSAIIDAFTCLGAEIYVSTYTDPGMQVAATPTYPVRGEIRELIENNPNVVQEAKNALGNRYNQTERNKIQNEVNANYEDAQSNVESGIEDHITRQKEHRQQYLEALAGGY